MKLLHLLRDTSPIGSVMYRNQMLLYCNGSRNLTSCKIRRKSSFIRGWILRGRVPKESGPLHTCVTSYRRQKRKGSLQHQQTSCSLALAAATFLLGRFAWIFPFISWFRRPYFPRLIARLCLGFTIYFVVSSTTFIITFRHSNTPLR